MIFQSKKCVWRSIVFLEAGEKVEEEIHPRKWISVTLLSGFAGYRCLHTQASSLRTVREWKVKCSREKWFLNRWLCLIAKAINCDPRPFECVAVFNHRDLLHSSIISSRKESERKALAAESEHEPTRFHFFYLSRAWLHQKKIRNKIISFVPRDVFQSFTGFHRLTMESPKRIKDEF